MPNKIAQTSPKFAVKRLALGLLTILVALLVLGVSLGRPAVKAARGEPIGLTQFQQLWDRSDKPVAEGRTARSWVWGPTLAGLETETYTQGNTRQVQYFDKTRMEQTESRGVSNGLLAKELITGAMQTGDQDFKQYPPDTLHNIAGDQIGNVPNPTYASFRKVATINVAQNENKAGDQTGQTLTATLDRDGNAGVNPSLGPAYKVKNAFFEKNLGHNIPDVFWNFMNGTGLVYRDGQFVQDRVFDWVVAVGLPLSEAYWTRSVFGGQTLDILVQVFERRVLTFTPANSEAFRVEMGNVGQHYRDWRASVTAPTPEPTPTPVPPTPTPTPAAPTFPQVPSWTAPRLLGPTSPSVQQLWRPVLAVNPVTGVAYIIGDSGSGTASAPAKALLLTTSDNPGKYTNIEDAPAEGVANDKYTRLVFGPDGTAYVAYRQVPSPNWRGWLRQIKPDGTLLPGVDIGLTYKNSGGGDTLDEPDIAFSTKTGKLYITGLIGTQASSRWWGYAESGDGGKSWSNFMTLGDKKPGDARDLFPRICVDNNDNVHVAALWGSSGSVVVRSRINGTWQNFQTLISPGEAGGWLFRNRMEITCGGDGHAYVAYDAPNSVGLGHFTPGQGWSIVNRDVLPGQNKGYFDLTTTPDGRVWLTSGRGTPEGGNDNITVVSSADQGKSFGNEQVVIGRVAQVSAVRLNYSAATNKLYLVATYKEPGPRESFFLQTK